MGSIIFVILGLIFELLSFFSLFYSSVTGAPRLMYKFCITNSGVSRFGDFIQNHFCWGNKALDRGIVRFFYVLSALLFTLGFALQIMGFFVIEKMSVGEISLIWPILIMIIILVIGFSFIAFKDKKIQHFLPLL